MQFRSIYIDYTHSGKKNHKPLVIDKKKDAFEKTSATFIWGRRPVCCLFVIASIFLYKTI